GSFAPSYASSSVRRSVTAPSGAHRVRVAPSRSWATSTTGRSKKAVPLRSLTQPFSPASLDGPPPGGSEQLAEARQAEVGAVPGALAGVVCRLVGHPAQPVVTRLLTVAVEATAQALGVVGLDPDAERAQGVDLAVRGPAALDDEVGRRRHLVPLGPGGVDPVV